MNEARPEQRRPFERKSLFVPVWTRPEVQGCWTVNLSEGGLGLVAQFANAEDGPREGEPLEVDFPLPNGTRVHAQGTVRWRHRSLREGAGGNTALGVNFTRFEGRGLLELRRFLAEHQMKVVVAGAPRGLGRALDLAFRQQLSLMFASDPNDVEQLLARGDVAAVLVCGEDEIQAVSLAHLINQVTRASTEHLGRPPETRPRVVFAAQAIAERLVELFNAGAIVQALPSDAPVSELRDAVLAQCRAHEVQLAQQRMAVELERILRDRQQLPQDAPLGVDGPGFGSPQMREVIAAVRQVAPFKVTALLQGETGTGKEVLANRLHALSPRAGAPFVVQDCGALPENLLESELFGHVKGAFTGAVSDHPGLFVLADGGTIFLDEIENTTANLQVRLLRVLEAGEVRAVGGTLTRRVDVRVVAASNRDLASEVAAGRFRADLFYRLNTFLVDVPPLRQRAQDVLTLAAHFVEASNQALGKSAVGFTPEAEAALTAWPWPGNVRELRNVVERAVLLSTPLQRLGPGQLPAALRTGPVDKVRAAGLRAQVEQFERGLLEQALAREGGVVRRAARAVQLDPVTFARRARKLGLVVGSTG